MKKVTRALALAGLLSVAACTTGNYQGLREDKVRLNQIQVLGDP